MRQKLVILSLILVAATWAMVSVEATRGVPAETSVADSPLFDRQLADKLAEMTLDVNQPLLAPEESAEPVQEAILFVSEGVSACIGSACIGSGCTASACGGSGCGGSACAGSACPGSVCGGSACAGSICAGSACGGSLCGGSACGVSGCAGSLCSQSACAGSLCGQSACAGSLCSSCPGDSAAAAAACTPAHHGQGRVVGLDATPTFGGTEVTWITTGMQAQSYRLYRLAADGSQNLIAGGEARNERMMRILDPAAPAGGSYIVVVEDEAGRQIVVNVDGNT